MSHTDEEVRVTDEDMAFILRAKDGDGLSPEFWAKVKALVRRIKAAERFIEAMKVLGAQDATDEAESRYNAWLEETGK